MASYIAENKGELNRNHYVTKATASNHWFNFSRGKLTRYVQQFSDGFCLIVNGSTSTDDAYIMPFGDVKPLFTEENLEDSGRRWVGTIINDIIRVRRQRMSVSAYHNAFQLLDTDQVSDDIFEAEILVLEKKLDSIDLPNLHRIIRAFNDRFRHTAPHKRISVSELVARPGALTDYLKSLHKYTCQLCHQQGFRQKNGRRYAEAHHVMQLHNLIPGSYCSDNIVIICANCHRKLHYADVQYIPGNGDKVKVIINDEELLEFRRNIITQESRQPV
jgi:5-methylcytosine-specific restriction endonuclease McrA